LCFRKLYFKDSLGLNHGVCYTRRLVNLNTLKVKVVGWCKLIMISFSCSHSDDPLMGLSCSHSDDPLMGPPGSSHIPHGKNVLDHPLLMVNPILVFSPQLSLIWLAILLSGGINNERVSAVKCAIGLLPSVRCLFAICRLSNNVGLSMWSIAGSTKSLEPFTVE